MEWIQFHILTAVKWVKSQWRESFHKLSDVNSTPEDKRVPSFLSACQTHLSSSQRPRQNRSYTKSKLAFHSEVGRRKYSWVCVCVCVCVCVSFTRCYIIGWTDRAHYIRPPLYVDQCTRVCSGWYQRTSVCDGARWREHEVTVKQLLGYFSLIIKMSALVMAGRRL